VYYQYTGFIETKVYVPYSESGLPMAQPPTISNYSKLRDVPGNLTKYNFAPAYVDFDPTLSGDAKLINFKRSDTIVFAAAARVAPAAGKYIQAFPYRWYSSELDRENMTPYYKQGYKWKTFVQTKQNSFNDTLCLVEILNYATDKSAEQRQQVLRYCHDNNIVTDGLIAGKLYETSEFYYKYETLHTDCSRGQTVFGGSAGSIYLSKDGGLSYPYTANIPGLDRITRAYIWANGNITFATLNKLYLATDNLATVTEIIPVNYAGNSFTTQTGEAYLELCSSPDPIVIDGHEILLIGSYCNINYNSSSQVFYSVDNGVSFRNAYAFGQNSKYKVNGILVGDPSNPVICRHIHAISFNQADNAFWIQTGDDVNGSALECNWIKGLYNTGTDTWTWNLKASGNTTSVLKAIGMRFNNNNIYWGSDSNGSNALYKCIESDITNPANYVTVIPHQFSVFDMESNGNMIGAIFTIGRYNTLLVSHDFGTSFRIVNLQSLTTLIGNTSLFREQKNESNGWYRYDPLVYPWTGSTVHYNAGVLWVKLK
jgi:hypothetical protein